MDAEQVFIRLYNHFWCVFDWFDYRGKNSSFARSGKEHKLQIKKNLLNFLEKKRPNLVNLLVLSIENIF